jgi:hypothetical protein
MIITNLWNCVAASNAGALSGTFVTNGGYVEFFFAGSAWSATTGVIGANLLIDGNVVATARGCTNEGSSHKCLVPASIVTKLAPGSHTASIAIATPQTKIDQNDFFTLAITELSFS